MSSFSLTIEGPDGLTCEVVQEAASFQAAIVAGERILATLAVPGSRIRSISRRHPPAAATPEQAARLLACECGPSAHWSWTLARKVREATIRAHVVERVRPALRLAAPIARVGNPT